MKGVAGKVKRDAEIVWDMNCGKGCSTSTRNTLDCDQSNYSSRIVFSHIPIECGHTGNGAIRSADPEKSILEPKSFGGDEF